MDQITEQPRHSLDARSLHEAGYTVAARVLGIEIRPSRRTLRCFEGDLLPGDTYGESDLEPLAIVALSGHIALDRHGGDGDRDTLLAGDLIFAELFLRYGPSLTPAHTRQYVATRFAELSDKAEQLVAENWPAKSRPKRPDWPPEAHVGDFAPNWGKPAEPTPSLADPPTTH